MNVIGFYYSLSEKERKDLLDFVKSLLMERAPDVGTLTPMKTWMEIYKWDFNRRLTTVFNNPKNQDVLNKEYVETMTEKVFRSMDRAGPKAWYEFVCLRFKYQETAEEQYLTDEILKLKEDE